MAPVLMGLFSLTVLMANQLGQEEVLRIERAAWYQKKHATFSDMLRAVRLTIWREYLIPQKAKLTPSVENISSLMSEWAEALVRRMLQAA